LLCYLNDDSAAVVDQNANEYFSRIIPGARRQLNQKLIVA